MTVGGLLRMAMTAGFGVIVGSVRRSHTAATGGLVVGAEPADVAALLLGAAFVVEGDEAREEFGFALGRERMQVGPAVGFEHGGVQLVVDLPQQRDEALVVEGFLLGVQRVAGAELFEDIVKAGEREVGILLLLAFAVGVQTLPEVADALLQWAFGKVGEGEGVEAGAISPSWPILKGSSCFECPNFVD